MLAKLQNIKSSLTVCCFFRLLANFHVFHDFFNRFCLSYSLPTTIVFTTRWSLLMGMVDQTFTKLSTVIVFRKIWSQPNMVSVFILYSQKYGLHQTSTINMTSWLFFNSGGNHGLVWVVEILEMLSLLSYTSENKLHVYTYSNKYRWLCVYMYSMADTIFSSYMSKWFWVQFGPI